jgi:hypothetical protein
VQRFQFVALLLSVVGIGLLNAWAEMGMLAETS